MEMDERSIGILILASILSHDFHRFCPRSLSGVDDTVSPRTLCDISQEFAFVEPHSSNSGHG